MFEKVKAAANQLVADKRTESGTKIPIDNLLLKGTNRYYPYKQSLVRQCAQCDLKAMDSMCGQYKDYEMAEICTTCHHELASAPNKSIIATFFRDNLYLMSNFLFSTEVSVLLLIHFFTINTKYWKLKDINEYVYFCLH